MVNGSATTAELGEVRGVASSTARHVLFVTAHFPPNRRAGTHRLLRFARNLDAMGWRVSVLTIDPSAYRDGVPLDERLLAQVPATVHVTRTGIPGRKPARPTASGRPMAASAKPASTAPPKRNAVSRAVRRLWQDLTSTPDHELPWWFAAVPAGTRLVREQSIDAIVSSAPPFTAHLIAAEIARRTGRPWVADFRDPWSRAPWGLEWRNRGWTGAVHRALERFTIRRATRVVLNTPPMREDFVAHYPHLPSSKFLTIPNGFDRDALDASVRDVSRTAPASTLVICHTGNLYQARDPRPLLRALASLREQGRVPRDAFRLQLVGGAGGEFDTAGEVARLGIADAIEFVPPVSHGESLGYLRAADVLLVVQPDTAVQVPVKLYEYLWARKPILALASPGAVADLIAEGQIGTVVRADDEDAIREALFDFYRRRTTLAQDHVAPAAFLDGLEGGALTRRLHDVLAELTR